MVQGFAAGYFAWDLLASIQDVGVHGWGALFHAMSALTVSMMGFVGRSFFFAWCGSVREWTLTKNPATFCQLLRPEFRSLRALNALFEYPLVA